MSQANDTLFTAPLPQSRSLAGQSVIGETVTSPWFSGTWEITQGWGQTDYDGEPEGHGAPHWHAGVDVGLDCGTMIELPHGLSGTARSFDNPDGYGTALVVLVDGGPAVLLGHLRQRLVDDGQVLSGGELLAVSNNTGNSTGCHTHFEVRPQDPRRPLGMAAYGTDLDPSSLLLFGQPGPAQAQLLAQHGGNPVADAIGSFMATLLNGGQVLLGSLMVVAGLGVAAYGARGGTREGLGDRLDRVEKSLKRVERRQRTPRKAERLSPAEESRIRPDLQRQPAAESAPTPGTAPAIRRALPAPRRALPAGRS